MTAGDPTALIDFHSWARDRVLDATVPLTPEQFTRSKGSDHGGTIVKGTCTIGDQVEDWDGAGLKACSCDRRAATAGGASS